MSSQSLSFLVQNRGADTRLSFSPSVLFLKLQLQIHFLVCRHMPFTSVYARAVGRCYELHCDKALCKPSLSVWLSVCLSLVCCGLYFPLFWFFPSAHSVYCISIFSFSPNLGKECFSCLYFWVQDCSDSKVCVCCPSGVTFA